VYKSVDRIETDVAMISNAGMMMGTDGLGMGALTVMVLAYLSEAAPHFLDK
jgi:hypothetical protein